MTVNRGPKVGRPPYADIAARSDLYYDPSLLPVPLKNPYDMLPCDLMKCFVMAFDRGIFDFTSPEESQVRDPRVVLYHRLILTLAPKLWLNHEYWAKYCG
jgi:hypothetical protein